MRFDYRRDIVAGSALDFSGLGLRDAPAGRYGRTVVVGDHFEFERLPGVPQRFYGVNLCMSLNYPTHEEAECLITRLKRIGYNSIRLHHHDRLSVKARADSTELDAANMDRLDYLIATAVREGLYLTTDVYVSRPVAWRAVGIDREGAMPSAAFKALTIFHEGAYSNYLAHARAFLCHENPYTHRRLVDEPALTTLVTVNENWLCMGWKHVCGLPEVASAYADWRKEFLSRPLSKSFASSVKENAEELDPWKENAVTTIFFADMERKAFARKAADLRKLGVRCPFSAGNHGPNTVPNQVVRSEVFEYVDVHSYVDHPTYLNTDPARRYQLPKGLVNRNYLDYFDTLPMNRVAFARVAGKPFAVSEWNFCGPADARAMAGLYGGALAAVQDWSAIHRFAYAHDIRHLADGPREPGAFDVSADPIMLATERQMLPLFLRGDLARAEPQVNLTIDERALRSDGVKAMPVDPSVKTNLMFAARVSCGCRPVSGAANLPLADYANMSSPVPFAGTNACVSVDCEGRVLTVATPCTSGVAIPAGMSASVPDLSVRVTRTAATVAVTSLDGRPVRKSGRMLVSHLTDAKGRGAAFADVARTIHASGGDGEILLADGCAEIDVRLENADEFRVYALASTGERRFEVPHEAREGKLSFVARTRGADGMGVMEYEIVREDKTTPVLISNGRLAVLVDDTLSVPASVSHSRETYCNSIVWEGRRYPAPTLSLLPQGRFVTELSFGAKETNRVQRIDLDAAETSVEVLADDGSRFEGSAFVALDENVIVVRHRTFGSAKADLRFLPPQSDRIPESSRGGSADLFSWKSYGRDIVETGVEIVEFRPTPNETIYCLAFADSLEKTPGAVRERLAKQRNRIASEGFESVRDRHRAAWGSFYAESSVSCPDAELMRIRKMAEYQLRCHVTEWSIPVGLTPGLWEGNVFAFDELYAVEGLLSAGHLSAAKRVVDYRFNTLKNAHARNGVWEWKNFGNGPSYGARWVWQAAEDDVTEAARPGFWLDHIFHMASIARSVELYWRSTRDESALRERVYPIVLECARYYARNWIYEDADGKYVGKCTDLERLGPARDHAFMTTVGVISTLRTAAEMAGRLDVTDGETHAFRETAEALVKTLPVRDGGYACCPGSDEVSFGLLAGHFPFSVFPGDDPLQRRATERFLENAEKSGNMYAEGRRVCPWYAAAASVASCVLGRGDEQLRWVREAARSAGRWGEFWEINEPSVRRRPWFMTAAATTLTAIDRLFLAEVDGEIRIASGVPLEWKDFAFDLPAPCGVRVKCAVRGGEVVELSVTGALEGRRIVLPAGLRLGKGVVVP